MYIRSDSQRNNFSQEVTVLQAMVMKDKTNLPHLKYRDRGLCTSLITLLFHLYALFTKPFAVLSAFLLWKKTQLRFVMYLFSNVHLTPVCLLDLFCVFFRLHIHKEKLTSSCLLSSKTSWPSNSPTLTPLMKRFWMIYVMYLSAKLQTQSSKK